MISFSLQGLILSVILASIVSVFGAPVPTPTPQPPPTSPPPTLDACGILASKNSTERTYDLVANCYRSIPFDQAAATTTLKTIHDLFRDYYIFRDSALSATMGAPFSTGAVDIVKKLEEIGQTQYTSDYTFYSDVRTLISTLHDAHAGYNVDCYNAYLFAQTLTLYAPVIDGKQSVRVYRDFKGRGVNDCEVVTIDNEDALTHLTNFANTLGFSKDGGVRLNQALANEIYSRDSGDFITSSGDYAERVTLPSKAVVDYHLRCTNGTEVTDVQIQDPWRIFSLTRAQYTDLNSYVANVCRPAKPSPPAQPSNVKVKKEEKRAIVEPTFHVKPQLYPVQRKSIFLDSDAIPSAPTPAPPVGFPDAERLLAGNATVFYHLKSQPDVGVIVAHTHDVEEGELEVILQGLAAFHQLQVKRILIDFQGNGGGSVAYASFLVQFFFPNKNDYDKSLRSDLRVNPSIQALSKAVFGHGRGGLYNAGHFIDLATLKPYTTNALFDNPVSLNRNGHSDLYSALTTLQPSSLSTEVLQVLSQYPWTNDPKSVQLLTDGRCGSSCALSTHYFNRIYNVTAYAVGGLYNQPLSMFSFAGGAVSSLTDLNKLYEYANITTPLTPLPYKGDVRLPVLEVYADYSDVPLEYDYTHYAAAYRLDFDPENARNRVVMWDQVASHAWA